VTDPPPGFPRVLAHLIYEDVDAAIAWLTEVFGFRERIAAHHEESDGTTSRTQIEVADSLITIGRPSVHADSPRRGVSSMLYYGARQIVRCNTVLTVFGGVRGIMVV